MGPFCCPQAFGCPSAQWICTSWPPCCSRHAAPGTQPVCLNVSLGMAHFGFGSEAIPHAMGDTPLYRGQISENSHFHPSHHEWRRMNLRRWKRCEGMGRDTMLARLVPGPSRPTGFSRWVPPSQPPSAAGCFLCTKDVSTFPTTRNKATTQTRGCESERLRVHRANLILPD